MAVWLVDVSGDMMHWFDIGTGIALVFGGIWSLFRGLTREVISILGIVAACMLSAWGAPYVATALEPVLSLPWLRQAIGLCSIFLVAVVGYVLLAKGMRRLVKAAGLSLPDRVLGGLFGLIKVGVLISAVVIVLTKFFPDVATHIATESRLAPTFFYTAQLLTTLLPEDIHTDFQRFYDRVEKRFKQWLPAHQLLPQATPMQQPSVPPQVAPPPQQPPGISASDERALRQLIRERWQGN
jgi:membrane protein required for colicin V production